MRSAVSKDLMLLQRDLPDFSRRSFDRQTVPKRIHGSVKVQSFLRSQVRFSRWSKIQQHVQINSHMDKLLSPDRFHQPWFLQAHFRHNR